MRSFAKILALAGAATCLAGAPAMAHHSFAMFDNTKNVTLDGTVKEFQWGNPHSWVILTVVDPTSGKTVDWSIETGSITGLFRTGWNKDTAKPGDKAVAVIHPLKDGRAGGSLHTLTIDGKVHTTER
jgi:hypothetical protein